jgi:hypothetical protein
MTKIKILIRLQLIINNYKIFKMCFIIYPKLFYYLLHSLLLLLFFFHLPLNLKKKKKKKKIPYLNCSQVGSWDFESGGIICI